MIETKLKELLEKNIDCHYLEIINESHLHHDHAGSPGTGQSHFKVVLVSREFDNQPRVARHMMVNNIVSSLFDEGLHALSMDVLTEKEYIGM